MIRLMGWRLSVGSVARVSTGMIAGIVKVGSVTMIVEKTLAVV
jgi:hypothetical protein